MLLQSPVQLLHGLYCCSPKLTFFFFFFFANRPIILLDFFGAIDGLPLPSQRLDVCHVPVPVAIPTSCSCTCTACQSFVPMGVPAAFPHVAAGWVAPPPPSVVVSVMIVYRIVQLAASPSAAQAMPCRNMEIEDGDRGGVKHTPRSWRAASHACARYTALP